MIRKIVIGVFAVATLASGTAAIAHDFFLLPEQFQTQGPGPLSIQATVGSSFPTPEAAVPADRAERPTAAGPGNPRIEVVGAGPKALNLELAGATAGVIAIGVGSKPRDVEYAEDRIPLILEEYRVAPQAAAAVEALPRPRSWQVVSRRFAKTFVCVASCADRSAAERPFGAHLEFVGSRASADRFRLLAHGKPLADYPIDLVGPDGKRQHLRTDAQGNIRLGKDFSGTTMLFAAKLEPPVGAGRFTLDLTSLTFSR